MCPASSNVRAKYVGVIGIGRKSSRPAITNNRIR
jgi:hypothetical protein